MVEGEEDWKLAPGDRRRGGSLHDEIAQGRGGEQLAAPHSRERQEQQPKGNRGDVGRGAALLIQL